MSEPNLKEAVLKEISLILSREIGPTEDLLVEGGLDSFAMLQVVIFLEEFLGTALPESLIATDNFATAEVIIAWAGTFEK